MKTSKPLQILTVAFALSLLAAYVVHSQRQQARTVAPGSKSRVLDELPPQRTPAAPKSVMTETQFTVAPGSKGGVVRLAEPALQRSGAQAEPSSGVIAPGSKSFTPLLKIQPGFSTTGTLVTLEGRDVLIFGSEIPAEGSAPADKSIKVFPGSKSAVVFTTEELKTLVHFTNQSKPAVSPAETKTNSSSNLKSRP
jgi:hypothetical protein